MAEEGGRRSMSGVPEGRPALAGPGAVERYRVGGSFLAEVLVEGVRAEREAELPGLADFFVRRGVEEEDGGGAGRLPEDAEGSTGGVGGSGVAAADASSEGGFPGRRLARGLPGVTCLVSGSAAAEPDDAGCAGAADDAALARRRPEASARDEGDRSSRSPTRVVVRRVVDISKTRRWPLVYGTTGGNPRMLKSFVASKLSYHAGCTIYRPIT
mmetsp:Transcript_19428/g.62357  ORF Transcript_19428/g.62357 Transcript_19428/m.62357 type:complete len:213 (-) Transcript_19428:58-696(-)